MSADVLSELDLESLRARFMEYTRNAYPLLPRLERLLILDVGCGSGLPALEVARLSDGHVVGIDIDQRQLVLSLEGWRRQACPTTRRSFADRS